MLATSTRSSTTVEVRRHVILDRLAVSSRHQAPGCKGDLGAGSGPLLTTALVVGETWTFLARRAGHRSAVQFLDAAGTSSRLTVRHVDDDVENEARRLRRRDERQYSFVDATSFTLMRRLRIREALAFDGDFSAAGFTELRP